MFKQNNNWLVRKTNIPLLAKAMELLSYWNLMDIVRPVVKKAITLVLIPSLTNVRIQMFNLVTIITVYWRPDAGFRWAP